MFLVYFPLTELSLEKDPVKFKEKAEKFDNTTIQVKGFLYRDEHETWVLSSEPNLKSCCVGKGEKGNKQILLGADFSGIKTQFPLTLEGTFRLNDRQFHPMTMDNAYIVEEDGSSVYDALLIMIIIVSLVIFYISIKKLINYINKFS